MVGKLTQTTEGLAIVLSPEIIERLGIDAETTVEITTVGESLVVSPVPDADRRARFQAALHQTNERFGDALRRLAE